MTISLPLVAMVGSLVILGSLAYYFSPKAYTRNDKYKHLSMLDKAIEQKTIELYELRDRVEHNQIDPSYNLTMLELEVLDIYVNSNIRIPTEILEDMHRQKLEDYADIFKYIETQRNYWKFENQKKPFKK